MGATIGNVFDFSPKGIDFALTALFVTVFVEQWLTSKNHTAAVIGVAASVICLIIFGKENFLIPAMITITISLTIFRFIKKGENNCNV